jgi:hypothetical protein
LSAPLTTTLVGLSLLIVMPAGGSNDHRVRVAELQHQLLAVHLGAVTGADDLERPG